MFLLTGIMELVLNNKLNPNLIFYSLLSFHFETAVGSQEVSHPGIGEA